MGIAIKAGFGVIILCVAVLAIYGYVVDMAPAPAPQAQGVVLNGQ